MVRTQQLTSYPDKLLVGSDLPEAPAARRELEQWAEHNGYYLPKDVRRLSVFEQGAFVREWVLAERIVNASRAGLPSFNPFAGRAKKVRERMERSA